jgi:hypothetical protein
MKKIKMVVLRCHVLANTTLTATCIIVLRDAIADAKIGRFIKNSTMLLRPMMAEAVIAAFARESRDQKRSQKPGRQALGNMSAPG